MIGQSTIPRDTFDEFQVVDRQQAAAQQIDMAIELMSRKQYACAITLALAAEDQIPNTGASHVWRTLQTRLPKERLNELNSIRNWLKHYKAESHSVTLYEFEVILSLLRAISKFSNTYKALTPDMAAFDAWVKERFLGRSDETGSHPRSTSE